MKIQFGGKNPARAKKSGLGVSSLIGTAAAILTAAGFLYFYSERGTISSEEDVKSASVLSETLREMSVPEIVKKAKPSVVGISSAFGENSVGTGTGIIFSEDGYIVTNAHVVQNLSDGKRTPAESVTVVLADKTEYPAQIIGADSRTDLAVVKINGGAESFSAAEFGDSRRLVRGRACGGNRKSPWLRALRLCNKRDNQRAEPHYNC